MATFELARAPLGTALRDWRTARSLPLYAGGLLAGLAIGLGIAAATAGSAGEGTPATIQYQGAEIGVPAALLPVIANAPAETEPAADTSVDWLAFYEPEIGANAFPVSPTMPTMSDAAAVLPPPVVEPEAPVVQPAAPPAPSAPAAPAAPIAQDPAPAAAPALPQSPPVQPAAEAPPAPAPAPAAEPAKPNFYVPAVGSGPLNGAEQRFFDAANKERVAAGLAPLTLDTTLTKIARTRSQQLVDQGYFGHTDPYGYSMYVELLSHFGIQWYAWAGENLAMNNYGDGESPERAVVALMNSPTHKRNILATEFSRLGVGLVTAGDGRKYYTMIFLG